MRIYAQLGTWPCWWRQGSPLKQACKLYEQLALDYFVVQPLAVMVIWWRYVVTKPHDISNAETWNPNVYTYSGLLWEYEKTLRWLMKCESLTLACQHTSGSSHQEDERIKLENGEKLCPYLKKFAREYSNSEGQLMITFHDNHID